MHSGGAAHLSNAADALFDLFRGSHHKVGQLIDHNDDVRQRRLADLGFIVVVTFKITHTDLREKPITLHHFHDRPLQRACRFFRVGHDRNVQVRDAVIDAEFDHFRVDHNKTHLVRRRLIEQGENKAVHAHALTAAGRTGDKHMRQLGDIADDTVSADVLADSEAEPGCSVLKDR